MGMWWFLCELRSGSCWWWSGDRNGQGFGMQKVLRLLTWCAGEPRISIEIQWDQVPFWTTHSVIVSWPLSHINPMKYPSKSSTNVGQLQHSFLMSSHTADVVLFWHRLLFLHMYSRKNESSSGCTFRFKRRIRFKTGGFAKKNEFSQS